MKKAASIFCAVLILWIAFAGCAGTQTTPEPTGELRPQAT